MPVAVIPGANRGFGRCRIIAVALHPGQVQTERGGANAGFTVANSLCGLRKFIAGLTARDAGGFSARDGQRSPS